MSELTNTEIIEMKAIVADTIAGIEGLVSSEGFDRMREKGTTKQGLLRDMIVNILHQAHDTGVDYRHVVLSAVMIFAGELGTASPEYANLQDIIGLYLGQKK